MHYCGVAKRVLALILLALFSAPALAQTALIDPSFELPPLNAAPNFLYRPSMAGATFTGGAGIARNGSAWQFQPAPDGVQVGFLQATAAISQNVTGLTPGMTYAVQFRIAKRPITGANEVTVSFNGLPILKILPTDNGWVAMTTRAFTAGSTGGVLSFSTNYSGPDDVASGIDMVTIVPAITATPDASFETPDVGSGYASNPSVAGLTFTGDAGIAGNGSGLAPPAIDGHQIGVMRSANGAPASIALALTNLTPGASYAVRFYSAANPGQSCNLSLAFNGTVFSTFEFTSQSVRPMLSRIFTAPSTGSVGTLTFANAGMSGAVITCAIDLVAVVPVLPARLADPSFEVPDQGTGFAYQPNAPGVSFANNAGIAANGSAWGFQDAPDGHQVAFLQGGSSQIALNVTGFDPNTSGPYQGVLYAVQFSIAQRPGYGINPVTVAIDGTPLGTFTPASTSFTSVTSLWFTASKPTGTITFSGTNSTGDTGTAIDMVTVVPVPRVPQ